MRGLVGWVGFALWGILVRVGYRLTCLGILCRKYAEEAAGVQEYELQVRELVKGDNISGSRRIASFGGWDEGPEEFLQRMIQHWYSGESDWDLPRPNCELILVLVAMYPFGKPAVTWRIRGWSENNLPHVTVHWEKPQHWDRSTHLYPAEDL